MRHEHSLDALNFFLADVRQGLGPYLTIYLLTERHWAEDQIGFVMTIATVCGLIAQTPAGALTDASHAKRAIIAAAALVVTGASTLLPFMSSFVFVAGSQAAADAAAAFFGPALAAITLGIMGPRAFTRRIGRNESFNHAGNAFAAALAGVCAWMWGLMAGCIVAAQVVMVPMAILVGRKADIWGRKPLFLSGLAILSLRGFLYPLSNDRVWLFAVQSLDGVGAGLYGALFPLIVADLTRGTGHFNLAQGAVITAQGIGAALSTSLAGLVVVHAGFSAAFLVLAGIAASGFLLYFFGMAETRGLDAAAPTIYEKAPSIEKK